MILSAIGFSIQACGIKYLYSTMSISSFEVVYWRSFLMATFDYIFMRISKIDHMGIPDDLRPTVFLRAIVGFGGIAGYFTAIKLTSLSKASVLFFTNPIFTALNARLFLKESLSYYDWMAILFAFFGIILLQNPFGRESSSEEFDRTLDTIGSFMSLASAISASFAFMLMRKMGKRINFMVSPFYFGTFSTFISAPVAIYQISRQSDHSHYTAQGVLILICLSFFGVIG